MKTYSKNINLFLMDGTPSGRIKCTLANWTGIAYKIPRVDLELCKERADLKQSGVYLLFGESDDNQESVIYVGQADIRNNGEGILNRIQEHKKSSNKDYWSEAIVFTTSNNSFGPTEISYLENRFCNLASDSHRYEVKNENNPKKGNITEEKDYRTVNDTTNEITDDGKTHRDNVDPKITVEEEGDYKVCPFYI